ncbi:MAG: outer membrane lipoprotein carrier protein LolA [Proteobacteria bacterium]|nr:outer membrane lipoprotein carrier protein LolA [Pseudomonadota bacterium]
MEVRYSRLLEKPIAVSGRLEHREDGSLVRRVVWPYQEVTILQGENVSVERAGSKPRRFTLDRAPELRGMLASFGAILQGDRRLVDRHFAVSARGSESRWEITLTPRNDKLKRQLSRIVVVGTDNRPKCFTLEEPDGDGSLLALGVAGLGDLPVSLDRDVLHAWCTDGDGQ